MCSGINRSGLSDRERNSKEMLWPEIRSFTPFAAWHGRVVAVYPLDSPFCRLASVAWAGSPTCPAGSPGSRCDRFPNSR